MICCSHNCCYFSDEFNFYDYGRKTNQLLYNSPDPPSYPLERIDAPIFVFHSNRDLMVPQKVNKQFFFLKTTDILYLFLIRS